MALSIHSRQRVQRPASPRWGLLGPILRTRRGIDLVAVTAAHVMFPPACGDGETPVKFEDAEANGLIKLCLTSEAVQPAWRLLAQLRVRGALIAPRQKHISMDGEEATIGRAGDAVGENLIVWSAREARPCLLLSAQASFRMSRPTDGQVATFEDALRIASLDGAPLARPGEAGAIVTTEQRQLLGVMICASDDVAYAAPLDTFASMSNLVALSAREVDLYNRDIRAQSALQQYAREEREELDSPSNVIADHEEDLQRAKRLLEVA